MQQKFHIVQSLYCLSLQDSQTKQVTTCLHMLKDGQYLHQAFALFPKQFDPIIIMFVRMGELSGRLPDTLNCAITYLKFKQNLARKSKKYLIYPVLLFFVLFGVLYAFVHVVIPQLQDATLDLSTWNLTVIAALLDTLLISFLVLLAFIVLRMMIPKFSEKTAHLIFKIPFVGPLYYKLQSGYFLKILAILLSEKVPAPFALQCLQETIPFATIRSQYQSCAALLKQGQSAAVALGQLDAIQGVLITIDTDNWVKRLDDIAETQLQSTQERMSLMIRMIEPAMVLLTGGVITMLILSIFTPLYEHLHVMV
ncbi:MAG: type II secretion system F family protein [Pseudomonadota bacterium]